MCSDCGRIFCPRGCPGEEEAEMPRCSVCGGEVYADEAFNDGGDNIFCKYCLDNAEVSDILRIYGISDIKIFLSTLARQCGHITFQNKGE